MTCFLHFNRLVNMSPAITERDEQRFRPALCPPIMYKGAKKVPCFLGMGFAVLFKCMWLKDLDCVYDGVRGNNSVCKSIRFIVLKPCLTFLLFYALNYKVSKEF